MVAELRNDWAELEPSEASDPTRGGSLGQFGRGRTSVWVQRHRENERVPPLSLQRRGPWLAEADRGSKKLRPVSH